jgi:hypothetical protein
MQQGHQEQGAGPHVLLVQGVAAVGSLSCRAVGTNNQPLYGRQYHWIASSAEKYATSVFFSHCAATKWHLPVNEARPQHTYGCERVDADLLLHHSAW